MSFNTNILNSLREGTNDDTIDVTTTKDDFKDTVKTVSDAKNQDSTLGDIDIALQKEGEEVHTAKFDRCVKDVEKEGGVDNPYAICQASIGASAIKKDHRTKPDDEYDRTDRADEGMDNLQVPDDVEAAEGEYLEKEKLKNDVAKDASNTNEGIEPLSGVDMKQYYDKKVQRKTDGLVGDVVRWGASKLKVKITDGEYAGRTFEARPEEVTIVENNQTVGRMSKGKLEKLVEQNKKIATAYKKIIKVADIKIKNG